MENGFDIPTPDQFSTQRGWWEGWSFSKVFEYHEPMTVTGRYTTVVLLTKSFNLAAGRRFAQYVTTLSLSLLYPKELTVHSPFSGKASEVSGRPESYPASIRSRRVCLLSQIIFAHTFYPGYHRSKGITEKS